MSSERIALLEKVGFEWTGGVATWDERFAELCAYKERFGHTLVPVKWKENPLLGGWVSAQRYKGNQGKLNKEYEGRLNSIGFEWKAPNALPPAKDLNERIAALLAHKAEHGHLAVSQLDTNYPGLANWMTEQRRRHKNGTLPVEIKKRLDELDFHGRLHRQTLTSSGLKCSSDSKKYASANGAATVRVIDDETAKINRWVLTQRRTKKAGQLSDARFRALDAVGFIWQRTRASQRRSYRRISTCPYRATGARCFLNCSNSSSCTGIAMFPPIGRQIPNWHAGFITSA